MGRILAYRHPAEGLLDIGGRVKQVAFSIKHREDDIVIARHTTQVNGNDGLGTARLWREP